MARILLLVILAEDKNGSSLNIRCRHTREGEEAETGKDSKKQFDTPGTPAQSCNTILQSTDLTPWYKEMPPFLGLLHSQRGLSNVTAS